MELKREPSIDQVLDDVWEWSAKDDFKGYNKHDGLNSPFLRLLLGWAKWPRLIAIQSVMRSPVNIRPMLLVPKTLNPKGLALFAMGLLDRHRISQEDEHLNRAVSLLTLLTDNRALGTWAGSCWGYHYPWQDLGFFAPANTPNAVVTCFVCEAFLEGFRSCDNKVYLDTVGSAIRFFIENLTVLEENSDMLCLGYMPLDMSMKVMDVSILIGAVLAQYAQLTDNEKYLQLASRLVHYVVDKQTDYGAWYYTDPPADSPIRHDNYHTGFILDALWRYMEAADDWQWKTQYESGLAFYAKNLFNSDGSPRWMSDQDFPHDVHGAAQGLISFSLAVRNGYSYEILLQKIWEWAMTSLYNPEGRFYYRQYNHWTIRYTLLRWCNAWMFRGLAAYNVLRNNEA